MPLSRFIALWTIAEYPPDSVSAAALDAAEQRLRLGFPDDYREAVLRSGLPRPTIALLDVIVDRELDVRDVSDFLNPEEIAELTEDWRAAGLPATLVAFATDCAGNLFCFPAEAAPRPEAPIVFFDHDTGQVETIARSFTAWIEAFCGIAPH